MQAISFSTPDHDEVGATAKVFDAVILYDTIAAAGRGSAVLGRIAGTLEGNLVEICSKPWRLDCSAEPNAAEEAMRDITSAQVIILSTSGKEPLSQEFKNWFATILIEKTVEQGAVIALFGMDEQSARDASQDLLFIKKLCVGAKLDFFAPWSSV